MGLAQYLFRCGLSDLPLCSCGALETVDHYLLECHIYNNQRDYVREQLELNNIRIPLSKKLLLGGEALEISQQFIVQNQIYWYLKNTNKLYVL